MRAAAILIGLLALAPTSGKNDEPQWLAPLTGGGAPGCSKRLGMRQYRSDVIRYRESTICIEGEAQHARGCQEAARVQWRRGGVTKTFQLTDVFEQNFMIVDFAPDSSRVLIESEAPLRVGDEYFRNIQISTIEFSSTKIDWKNTWDLFGWGECEATVEPQGFTDEGEVVVRARPSVMARPRRPNCLKDVGLYAVDLQLGSVTRLPNDLRIQRYRELVHGPSHTSQSAHTPRLVGYDVRPSAAPSSATHMSKVSLQSGSVRRVAACFYVLRWPIACHSHAHHSRPPGTVLDPPRPPMQRAALESDSG